jgi:NADPH:quinone reductase-like Zn-dependent oxidoreductase
MPLILGYGLAGTVLRPGGQVISISGPPDLPFAKSLKLGLVLRRVRAMLGRGVLKKAKARGGSCSFLVIQADGGQLAQRAGLIDARVSRPVVDRVFPFDR